MWCFLFVTVLSKWVSFMKKVRIIKDSLISKNCRLIFKTNIFFLFFLFIGTLSTACWLCSLLTNSESKVSSARVWVYKFLRNVLWAHIRVPLSDRKVSLERQLRCEFLFLISRGLFQSKKRFFLIFGQPRNCNFAELFGNLYINCDWELEKFK